MLTRLLLATGLLGFTLSAALAQSRPGPAYFLHHPAKQLPGTGLPQPAGPASIQPATAPIPTLRAAAAYPALLAPASGPAPAGPIPPPRHFLAGSPPAPPYDLYQSWPEAQRKVTLPAPWAEPLPLQLLRGALGH